MKKQRDVFNAVDFFGWAVAYPDASDDEIRGMYLLLCDTERKKVRNVVDPYKEETMQ